MREQVAALESLNMRLITLLGLYCTKWINESRRAALLERFDPDDMPGLSQAGWLSSSPSRTIGQSINWIHTYLLTQNITGEDAAKSTFDKYQEAMSFVTEKALGLYEREV